MRWRDEVTLKFVKLYLNHECLWNPSHSKYKIQYEREKAYEKLSQDFKAATKIHLNKSYVKNKIRNLRTTYTQQVHKILIKSNPDKIYEPSLSWFPDMDRCLKNISGCRNANTTSPPEVDSSCQEWTEKEHNGKDDELHPNQLISENDDDYMEQNIISEDPHVKLESSSPVDKCYKKNKKKKNKRKSSNSTDSIYECLNKDDEFDVYGKHVANQLRNMNLHSALKLQLDIQNLISET